MKKIMGLWILLTVFSSSSLAMAQSKTSPISDEKAHEIVMTGTPDDVRKLLDSGYDVNKIYLCNTLLNSAIKSLVQTQAGLLHPEDVVEKIKILVNSGADVNKSGCKEKAFRPLSWVVFSYIQMKKMEQDLYKEINKKIVEGKEYCGWDDLISKPCKDITLEEHRKINAFFQEAYNDGYTMITPYIIQIMEYLINNGADINGKDTQGQTPLHLAALIPQNITIVPAKYLIDKGANVNAKDIYSQTPLFYAYGAKNKKIVELLIQAGADEKIYNNVGALYFQAENVVQTFNTIQDDGTVLQEYF